MIAKHLFFFFSIIFSLSSIIVNAKPTLSLVTEGLQEPVWAKTTPHAPSYIYILEKPGVIQIYDKESQKLLDSPFLDIRSKIKVRMNEQGLLGMTFCPDFHETGMFYINYTNLNGDTHISRYQCDPSIPNKANLQSEKVLLAIKQPYRNHNGGWIEFGSDRLLYISIGDGGAAFDPKNHAQNLSSHLGKLLRIDVIGKETYTIPPSNPFIGKAKAKPEIFAYGLRNPWRCCWDKKTGDFYIADVGQGKKEEINFIPKGKLSGTNFGWRKREGEIATKKINIDSTLSPSHYQPIYTYNHGGKTNEGISITGGFLYRGSIKELQGQYFFADWVNPRVWSIQVIDNKATHFRDWTAELNLHEKKIFKISSFAQDHHGELYIMDFIQGSLYKFTN